MVTRAGVASGFPELTEQPGEDFVVTKVIVGQLLCRPAMAWVIGIDALDGLQGVRHVSKSEQPVPGWQVRSESSVLADHGASGCEIGSGAIAEPAAAQADVLVLGHGELAARLGDIPSVGI